VSKTQEVVNEIAGSITLSHANLQVCIRDMCCTGAGERNQY